MCLSQTMVLSLWLVMPTAAKSEVSRPAAFRADLTHISTLRYRVAEVSRLNHREKRGKGRA